MSTANNGFVSLAGEGPGDAELITNKVQKRVAAAEVILTDRLVHPDIIHFMKDYYLCGEGGQGMDCWNGVF